MAGVWRGRGVIRALGEVGNSAARGRGEFGRSGKEGIRALFTPFPERQNSPLPLFPFEACHTGHVTKCGEMRGYRSLPPVNIARSTGSRTRNCSNKNPAGKIEIPLSRNTSHIQSLHRKLMLACADSRDFTIGRREGSENVASKMNLRSFVFIAIISTHLPLQM